MDKKILGNLQRYIGKRSKGQSDRDVIEHIEKVHQNHPIGQDEWEALLFPVCANCDTEILKYILSNLSVLNNADKYINHTLNFRNQAPGYEEKQVIVLQQLFAYVDEGQRAQVVNDALVNAVWFGEYESVKYLVAQGADLSYQSNGRNMLELAHNAILKFNDNRVMEFIEANR